MITEQARAVLNRWESEFKDVADYLAGRAPLRGVALEFIQEAIESVESGLAGWGSGYPREKLRQQKLLNGLKEVVQ